MLDYPDILDHPETVHHPENWVVTVVVAVVVEDSHCHDNRLADNTSSTATLHWWDSSSSSARGNLDYPRHHCHYDHWVGYQPLCHDPSHRRPYYTYDNWHCSTHWWDSRQTDPWSPFAGSGPRCQMESNHWDWSLDTGTDWNNPNQLVRPGGGWMETLQSFGITHLNVNTTRVESWVTWPPNLLATASDGRIRHCCFLFLQFLRLRSWRSRSKTRCYPWLRKARLIPNSRTDCYLTS